MFVAASTCIDIILLRSLVGALASLLCELDELATWAAAELKEFLDQSVGGM